MSKQGKSWRTSTVVRTLLVATLCGTTATGVYQAVSRYDDNHSSTSASSSSSTTPTESATPFTSAEAGSCLTWTPGGNGAVEELEHVDCAVEHRFEVSTVAALDKNEFGPGANRPDANRQAQIRQQMCQDPTVKYLEDRYDPKGRFSISAILPPADKWKAGDRTVVCGLQIADRTGIPQPYTGRVADQDQARTFQPGTCTTVDNSQQVIPVNCADPHQIEHTKVVDLDKLFPGEVPTVEEQDKKLAEVCHDAAVEFVGGDDKLTKTTLQPYWGVLAPERINGGSHSINCGLVKGKGSGEFAALAGSAKDYLTIDGQPPQSPKPDDKKKDQAPPPPAPVPVAPRPGD